MVVVFRPYKFWTPDLLQILPRPLASFLSFCGPNKRLGPCLLWMGKLRFDILAFNYRTML